MKNTNVLKFAAVIALAVWVGNVHAVTAVVGASATVTATCAAVAPSSIPAGAPGGNPVNVNCSSGTTYSVGMGVNSAIPNGAASGVPASGVMATVTY